MSGALPEGAKADRSIIHSLLRTPLQHGTGPAIQTPRHTVRPTEQRVFLPANIDITP
jgi:hypothetical protein